MSDMTSIGFAPLANAGPRPARRRPRRGGAEYRAYYALVLGAALPVAAAAFAADALRGRPGASPLARSRSHARAIAPMIFAP